MEPEPRKGIPLRVLVLEDSTPDLEMVLYELRRSGFDVDYQHAADERQFVSKLDPGLDVILADYSLPQFDALHALRILQEKDLHIPFIVVTGSISEEAAVACLKSGATDYLLKDRLARLGSAITQALEARKNYEAKLEAEEQIRRRNQELTLLNRIIAVSTESPDERTFLQEACDELSPAIGVRHALIAIIGAERTSVSILAEYCEDAEQSLLNTVYDAGKNSIGDRIIGLKAPLVVNALAHDARFAAIHAPLIKGGVQAMALVPMIVDGETVGALGLASDKAGHFSEERLGLARSVADQLSNALARTRLERERLRLSAAIEQATDAVIITDTGSRTQYVNPAFERVTGYTRSEVVGKPANFIMNEAAKVDGAREVSESMRAGEEWRGRLMNRKKDGTQYTVDMSLSPIRDKTGAIVNYVGVQRDITEALQLERRYLQAQKMEAIGRLAGGVAHDFNNLLTAIMGYTDILQERMQPASAELADLNEMRGAAERAAGLTRQLLAFSRGQVMRPQIVNLNTIVRNLERMLTPLIGEDIELRTSLHPLLGTVRADPGQIEQVIMNLVVNARDAMPNGGHILLATRNEEIEDSYAREHPGIQNGAYVVLTVSDTGTGISEDALPHIFEPFFTTKEEGKGTGLGLATVYGIVKQSGGYITSSSNPGKGTDFEILLPRLDEEAVQAARESEAEAPARGTGHILLVEDNEAVRNLARKVLARQGYDVTAASNPQEAVDYSSQSGNPIDMLITDVVMPGMSGKDLMEKIRSLRPGINVLLISGYMDVSDVTWKPGTSFLQKPFSPRSLIRAVQDVLRGETLDTESPSPAGS